MKNEKCPYQNICYEYGTDECPEEPIDCLKWRIYSNYDAGSVISLLKDDKLEHIVEVEL